MVAPRGIERVIVVVLDGLRPELITPGEMPALHDVAASGSSTLRGTTVQPSVTAAALASLFTGVPPSVHGILGEGALRPRLGHRLTLLPRTLARAGIPMIGHMRTLPWGMRAVGALLSAQLGMRAVFGGACADDILQRAVPTLRARQRGVTYLHWPDADMAGHRAGWMSAAYREAARGLDGALARLVDLTEVQGDPSAVLILLADHGGGGARVDDHDSAHPHDVTIPVVMAGGQVAAGELFPGTSPLDVCATVPWLFGVMPPVSWHGRPLREAFAMVGPPAQPALAEAA
jgi:predicted AlkP superfamily pyrophosphatase or phosphodiesterase